MKTTQPKLQLTHRERLLKEGMRHFYATGFHGTSVDELLAAAEAPKGSFYHHFGSKDAFAKAVVDAYTSEQLALLSKYANQENLSGLQKIDAYFSVLTSRFQRSQHKVACLVGKFATELAPSSDEFSALLSESMKGWRDALEELLAEGQKDGSVRRDMSPKQQSTVLFSLIQGALVIGLADRDSGSMAAVYTSLSALLGTQQSVRPKKKIEA